MSIGIRRSIECSPATLNEVFKNENNEIEKESPVKIKLKTNLTVNSTAKENTLKPNIQSEEYCITENSNLISINYSLKILNPFFIQLVNEIDKDKHVLNVINILSENIDNNKIAEKLLSSKIEKDIENLSKNIEKAKRFISFGFANRIVSCVAAWRNLDMSIEAETYIEAITINTDFSEDKKKKDQVIENFYFKNVDLMSFEPFKKEINKKDFEPSIEVNKPENEKDFDKLERLLYESIFNDKKIILKIKHVLNMGTIGATIYPSQLFTDDKTKKLYFINENNGEKYAGITSQKIQNALRRFDIFATNEKVIPFYENGSDLSRLENLRLGDNSFNGIMKKMIKNPKELDFSEIAFVYAILIKGLVNNN